MVSYADEIPDLAALRRARLERVAPERVGEPSAEPVDPPTKRKSRRRVMLAGRSLAALFAVLALAMTGGAWQWQSTKNNMLNRVSALDPNSRDIVDPNAQYGDENFLIVGIDSRFGAERRHGRGQHRGRRRRPLGHRHAGQHPGQPQTRCGGVVSARPGHRRR